MSQNQAVLKLLKAGWVTPLEALRECGCLRLAARIYELEFQGHRIVRKTVSANGKRFKAYRLE